MSNEEIVKEIDEAMESLRETKRKIGGAFSKARNIVIKDSTVDTEAYNKGLNDAWELAQKIVCYEGDGGISQRELEKIFDSFNTCEIMCLSYFEALAKLEAYEKEHYEIKVGDIVKEGENYFLVTKRYNNTFEGMSDEGYLYCGLSLRDCEKTSKHIDLTDIFKQIGSDADEI